MNLGLALTSAVTLDILCPKHDRNNALSSRLQLARLHRDLPDHPPPDHAFHTVKKGTFSSQNPLAGAGLLVGGLVLFRWNHPDRLQVKW